MNWTVFSRRKTIKMLLKPEVFVMQVCKSNKASLTQSVTWIKLGIFWQYYRYLFYLSPSGFSVLWWRRRRSKTSMRGRNEMLSVRTAVKRLWVKSIRPDKRLQQREGSAASDRKLYRLLEPEFVQKKAYFRDLLFILVFLMCLLIVQSRHHSILNLMWLFRYSNT